MPVLKKRRRERDAAIVNVIATPKLLSKCCKLKKGKSTR